MIKVACSKCNVQADSKWLQGMVAQGRWGARCRDPDCPMWDHKTPQKDQDGKPVVPLLSVEQGGHADD